MYFQNAPPPPPLTPSTHTHTHTNLDLVPNQIIWRIKFTDQLTHWYRFQTMPHILLHPIKTLYTLVDGQ